MQQQQTAAGGAGGGQMAFAQVTDALAVTYDVRSATGDRNAAYSFLEGFKAMSAAADIAAFAFSVFQVPIPAPGAAGSAGVGGAGGRGGALGAGGAGSGLDPAQCEMEHVRFFALHCLEELVYERWRSLDATMQLQVREGLLAVATRGYDMLSEPRSIVLKLAQLLAEIAKREYPQRWPEFFAQMGGMMQSGGEQMHLALHVLHALLEDCVDSAFNSHIASQRRRDILRTMHESIDGMLTFLYSYTQYACSLDALDNQNLLLLEGLVLLAHPLAVWLEAPMLSREEHPIAIVVMQLIQVPVLRTSALQVADLITGTKQGTDTCTTVAMPVARALADAVHCNLALVQQGSPDAPALDDWVSLAGSVANIVHYSLSTFEAMAHRGGAAGGAGEGGARHIEGGPETVQALFGAANELLGMGSRRVLNAIAPLYISALRCLRLAPFVDPAQICQAYLGAGMKLRWQDGELMVSAEQARGEYGPLAMAGTVFVEEDFEDQEAYTTLHALLRRQLETIMGILASNFAVPAAQFALEIVQEAIQNHGQVADFATPPQSDGTVNSTTMSTCILAWDVVTFAMTHLMGGYLEPVGVLGPDRAVRKGGAAAAEAEAAEVTARLGQAVQELLAFDPHTDGLLLNASVAVLHKVVPVLRHHGNDAVMTVLNRLFALLDYGPAEAVDPDAQQQQQQQRQQPTHGSRISLVDAIALHRRVGTCMAAVAEHAGDMLLEQMESLAEQIVQHIAQHGMHSARVFAQMELLGTIAARDPDINRAAQILMYAMDPVLQQLQASVQTLRESPYGLANLLNIAPGSADLSSAEVFSTVRGYYSLLMRPVHTILTVMRKVKLPETHPLCAGDAFLGNELFTQSRLEYLHPPLAMYRRIVPTLCELIVAIHEMWRPSFRGACLADDVMRSAYSALASQEQQAGLPHRRVSTATATGAATGSNSGSVAAGGGGRGVEELLDYLMPEKWSLFLHDLRLEAYQILNLAATQHVLFALQDGEQQQQQGGGTTEEERQTPLCFSVVQSVCHLLEYQDTRHVCSIAKQLAEPFLTHCPANSLAQFVAPFLTRLVSHMNDRMLPAWFPDPSVANPSGASSVELLATLQRIEGALCAHEQGQMGQEEEAETGLMLSYSLGGLAPICMCIQSQADWQQRRFHPDDAYGSAAIVGDALERLVQAMRVDLSRCTLDLMHTLVGLRGVFSVDPGRVASVAARQNGVADEEGAATAARDLHVTRLAAAINFGLFAPESAALTAVLVLSMVHMMEMRDEGCSRRAVQLLHRVLAITYVDPRFARLYCEDVFPRLVELLVQEPPWMQATQWPVIALLVDVFDAFVCGVPPRATFRATVRAPTGNAGGGGGSGGAFPSAAAGGAGSGGSLSQPTVEISGTQILTALQVDGSRPAMNETPRGIIQGLPGQSAESLAAFEQAFSEGRAEGSDSVGSARSVQSKRKKDAFRDLVRTSLLSIRGGDVEAGSARGARQAAESESILREQALAVPDLPEKLLRRSKLASQHAAQQHAGGEGGGQGGEVDASLSWLFDQA